MGLKLDELPLRDHRHRPREYFVGRVGLFTRNGLHHQVEVMLTWSDDRHRQWSGTLVAPLPWRALAAGPLWLDYPGHRRFGRHRSSTVQVVAVNGDLAQVRGTVHSVAPPAPPEQNERATNLRPIRWQDSAQHGHYIARSHPGLW